MSNADISFPYYSGNIRLTKSLGMVTLEAFTYAHKNPTGNTKRILKAIKNAKTPQIKRNLKHKLYSFTPSVVVPVGLGRSYSNVEKFTGLLQIDLDDVDDPLIAYDLKNWLYDQDECVASYFSPSGNVKGLIKISEAKTVAQYKRIWNAVEEKYEDCGYFDTSTKNAILPLFLSADEDIMYKDIRDCYTWSAEKEEIKEYASLNPQPNFNSTVGNVDYFQDRTLKLLNEKIGKIINNGHPQVRTAALILGSRVAAGYLQKDEAEDNIKYLILNNSYLSKGTKGYIETAMWGIKEGMKSPRYY